MKAHSFGLVFLFFVINSSLIEGKNFKCSYKNVKVHVLDKSFYSCEYKDIRFQKNDTFYTILPEVPKNNNITNTTDHIYDDDEIYEYVKRISFSNSRIYSIPNSVFMLFKNLELFDATSTRLHEMNALSFNKAEFLTHIFLQNNMMKAINDYTFVHCKNLKILDISNNRIEKIQRNAFSSLNYLEELNLAENHIKVIEDDTFESLIKVKWIWLNNNHMEFISSHIFGKENINLSGIYLNRNSLTAISPHAFESLEQLRFLFLEGNTCINENFKNHIIHDNLSIKYALKGCHKEYRKLFPDEEKKFNMTIIIDNLNKDNTNCIEALQDRIDELKAVEEAIEALNKKMNEDSDYEQS